MKGGILLLPALLCLLTGCGSTPWSNYEPVEDLLPVETVGFDFAEGQVEITVSCPGEGGTARLSARGGTLSAAAEALQTRAGGKVLFFPHCRYALFSAGAAESILEDVLPWFTGSGRARLAMPVFLLREGTARELMEGAEAGGEPIGKALEALVPGRRAVTLTELTRQLRRTGAALCPAVMPLEAGDALLPRKAGYALLRPGAAEFLPENAEIPGTGFSPAGEEARP